MKDMKPEPSLPLDGSADFLLGVSLRKHHPRLFLHPRPVVLNAIRLLSAFDEAGKLGPDPEWSSLDEFITFFTTDQLVKLAEMGVFPVYGEDLLHMAPANSSFAPLLHSAHALLEERGLEKEAQLVLMATEQMHRVLSDFYGRFGHELHVMVVSHTSPDGDGEDEEGDN